MRFLTFTAVLLATSLGTCAPQVARDAGPQDKEKAKAKAAALKQLKAFLAKEKISIDLKRKTLTIPVIVNSPRNDLEFLLIYPSGKKHESLLITPSRPSVINAGLIALGLKKGKNASFRKKDPMPSEEELKKGADPYELVAPKGPKVYMTVRYEGKDGKKIEHPVEDLLLDWTENLTVTGNDWIFLGGRMAQLYRGEDPVFIADYEGNLISCCYKYPHNHLLTIEHKRARDEMNWAKSARCPAPGTKMELTFHVKKPPLVASREARMKREAEERKKKGQKVDTSSRPPRNPAREGGGFPPPKKTPPAKKPPAEKKKPPQKGKAGAAGKKTGKKSG